MAKRKPAHPQAFLISRDLAKRLAWFRKEYERVRARTRAIEREVRRIEKRLAALEWQDVP